MVTPLKVIPCTHGKYGFSTFGMIALKSFAKIKLNLGKTSEKRGVLVSMNKDVVKVPTEGELLLINPPPRVAPAENKNCAFAVAKIPESKIK